MPNPWEKYQTTTSKPWESFQAPEAVVDQPQLAPEKPQSFTDRARQIYGERTGEMAKIAADYYPEQTMAEDAIQAMGQVGAGVGELGFEALKRGVQAVTPDSIEEAVANKAGELAQTDEGQFLLGKLEEYSGDYKRFAQENPRLHRNLAGMLGVAEAVPVGVAGKGAAKVTARYAPSSRKKDLLDVFTGTGDDVANIQGKVSKLADIKKREYTDLYKQAEELGENTFITGKSAKDLVGKLKFVKSKMYQPSDIDTVDNIVKAVEGIKGDKGINLNMIEGIRRDLGKGVAESKAKNVLNEVIAEAVDKGDMIGNVEAGQLWKEASNQFKQYKRTFDNPKMNPTIKSVVDTDLTPEDLASKMFGAGSIGTGRKAAQKYDEFVGVLGKDVEPDLKRAVVSKIMQFADEPSPDAKENMVWLQRVGREVSQLKSKNKSLWNKFSKEEQEALSRMGAEAQRAAEGGALNRAIGGVFNLSNKFLSKGGLKTDLRLPSTLSPKQVTGERDVLNLSRGDTPSRTQRLLEDIGVK